MGVRVVLSHESVLYRRRQKVVKIPTTEAIPQSDARAYRPVVSNLPAITQAIGES